MNQKITLTNIKNQIILKVSLLFIFLGMDNPLAVKIFNETLSFYLNTCLKEIFHKFIK